MAEAIYDEEIETAGEGEINVYVWDDEIGMIHLLCQDSEVRDAHIQLSTSQAQRLIEVLTEAIKEARVV